MIAIKWVEMSEIVCQITPNMGTLAKILKIKVPINSTVPRSLFENTKIAKITKMKLNHVGGKGMLTCCSSYNNF